MDLDFQRPQRRQVPTQPHANTLHQRLQFKTPEAVAEEDDRQVALEDTSPHTDIPPVQPAQKKQRKSLKQWLASRTKKQWVIIACIAVVVLGGLGYGAYYLWFRHTPKPVAHVEQPVLKQKVTKPVSDTVPSPLTGLPVSPSAAQNPVTGVMIENSDGARPQSGLSQAGIVFEALAEGGITRFMALYQEAEPSSIGPVRSARPYFVDWLLPYQAGYAHVGGSPNALNEVKSLGVRDLSQFAYGSYYTRVSSRPAPHNVYTSMSQLHAIEQSKGWTSSNFTGFARKADSPASAPNATSINLDISNADMAVSYQYDAKTNTYERSEAGSPMVDAANNQQLDPKVVVAMVVPWTDGPLDGIGAYYINYADVGSGTVYVFQDGVVTQGTWKKPSQSSPISLQSDTGATLKLNAGQTWITVLGKSSLVSYKP